jgi:hypothetical protein
VECINAPGERVFVEVRRRRGMLHPEFLGRPKNLRELLRKTVRESNSVCDPERDKTMFAQSFYAPNKKRNRIVRDSYRG